VHGEVELASGPSCLQVALNAAWRVMRVANLDALAEGGGREEFILNVVPPPR